jgi:hypothetical protein
VLLKRISPVQEVPLKLDEEKYLTRLREEKKDGIVLF